MGLLGWTWTRPMSSHRVQEQAAAKDAGGRVHGSGRVPLKVP